jgi:NADH-quinone oxidoreductase subunit M
MRDALPREVLAFAPIIVLTVAVGVFPKPLFDVVNPAIERTLSFVNVDPVPPDVPATSMAAVTDTHWGAR